MTRLPVQILKIDRKYRKLLQQLYTENWRRISCVIKHRVAENPWTQFGSYCTSVLEFKPSL